MKVEDSRVPQASGKRVPLRSGEFIRRTAAAKLALCFEHVSTKDRANVGGSSQSRSVIMHHVPCCTTHHSGSGKSRLRWHPVTSAVILAGEGPKMNCRRIRSALRAVPGSGAGYLAPLALRGGSCSKFCPRSLAEVPRI